MDVRTVYRFDLNGDSDSTKTPGSGSATLQYTVRKLICSFLRVTGKVFVLIGVIEVNWLPCSVIYMIQIIPSLTCKWIIGKTLFLSQNDIFFLFCERSCPKLFLNVYINTWWIKEWILEMYMVSWFLSRHNGQTVYWCRYTYTSDYRFKAIHKLMSEDYLLQIRPVQVTPTNLDEISNEHIIYVYMIDGISKVGNPGLTHLRSIC